MAAGSGDVQQFSISCSISQSCVENTGRFVVTVNSSKAQSLWVTFTGQTTGLITSATVYGVSSYTFTQNGLPNDTYSIVAHSSLTGNTAAFIRTVSCKPQLNGYKSYRFLEEYYIDNDQPTGVRKPNVYTDPDFVLPVLDDTCLGTSPWQPLYYTSGVTLGCFTGIMRDTSGMEADRPATDLERSVYSVAYGTNGNFCPF